MAMMPRLSQYWPKIDKIKTTFNIEGRLSTTIEKALVNPFLPLVSTITVLGQSWQDCFQNSFN